MLFRSLEQAGCPVLGCILNKVTFETISAKKYYNKSYYSHYNSEYYRREGGHGKNASASSSKGR